MVRRCLPVGGLGCEVDLGGRKGKRVPRLGLSKITRPIHSLRPVAEPWASRTGPPTPTCHNSGGGGAIKQAVVCHLCRTGLGLGRPHSRSIWLWGLCFSTTNQSQPSQATSRMGERRGSESKCCDSTNGAIFALARRRGLVSIHDICGHVLRRPSCSEQHPGSQHVRL